MLRMPVARGLLFGWRAIFYNMGGVGNATTTSKPTRKQRRMDSNGTTTRRTNGSSGLLRTTRGGNLSATASNPAMEEQDDQDETDNWVLTPERALQEIPPKCIGLGAGCAALINHVFSILGEPGDVCLIPQPYYMSPLKTISIS